MSHNFDGIFHNIVVQSAIVSNQVKFYVLKYWSSKTYGREKKSVYIQSSDLGLQLKGGIVLHFIVDFSQHIVPSFCERRL